MTGVARSFGIDPDFMRSLVQTESAYNPNAASPKGARGLMQIMPATARRFGLAAPERALQDPVTNLTVGATYLKTLQRRYGNNLPLILAAYNAGEGAVARYGARVPPYRETTAYVTRVLARYQTAILERSAQPAAE